MKTECSPATYNCNFHHKINCYRIINNFFYISEVDDAQVNEVPLGDLGVK